MFAIIRDWRQNLSWKIGFSHGKSGRKFAPPWWLHQTTYSLAFMQGKGVELT